MNNLSTADKLKAVVDKLKADKEKKSVPIKEKPVQTDKYAPPTTKK